MKPSMRRSDAVAHVVDIVRVRHAVARTEVERDLIALGFGFSDAGDIVYSAIKKKLIRSDGSTLRPPTISTEPHLEEDYMTGWWGIFFEGKYAGQRPTKAEAEKALALLVK